MKNKDAIGATLRALSKKNLDVNFQLSNDNEPKITPKSITLPEIESLNKMRGIADGVAARLRFHDENLHQELQPQGKEQFEIFDALETTRAEVLLSKNFPGVMKNIDATKIFPDTVAGTVSKILWHKALGLTQYSKTMLENWIELNAKSQFNNLLTSVADQIKFAEAVKDFTSSIALNPTSINLYYNRANANYNLKKRSIKLLENIIIF
jgi:cobaltochelatase CobT